MHQTSTAAQVVQRALAGLSDRPHSGVAVAAALLVCGTSAPVWGHGVADGDAAFIAQSAGAHIVPFMNLGAKHMVTGYDHLLFLLGVIFFLHRLRDVAIYVTPFALGHSMTLLGGVLGRVDANTWLVDQAGRPKLPGRHRHQFERRAAPPFDGIHGWYLQNQLALPVVVHLKLSGFYTLRRDPYASE